MKREAGQKYAVAFTSDDLKCLPEEQRAQVYGYFRIYGAHRETKLRESDREYIRCYRVRWPGHVSKQFSGTLFEKETRIITKGG